MSSQRIEGREYATPGGLDRHGTGCTVLSARRPHVIITSRYGRGMKTVTVIVGVLLVLSGLVWFLQGIDVLQGSSMTGDTKWAIIGPIVALVGAAMVFYGRGGRAASRD